MGGALKAGAKTIWLGTVTHATGQGQAVSQQLSSAWRHFSAQSECTAVTPAVARGATASEPKSTARTSNLTSST
jgi:hypothetical protein